MDVFISEDDATMLGFLRWFVARGLSGTELIISDCHAGFRAVVASVFCARSFEVHFCESPGLCGHYVADGFYQPGGDKTKAQFSRVVGYLHEAGYGAAAELLEGDEPDILAFTAFPKQYWR